MIKPKRVALTEFESRIVTTGARKEEKEGDRRDWSDYKYSSIGKRFQ